MPDISTVNGIDITTLSSFGGVAFADGQTLDGQNVALVSEAHTFISSQTASSDSSLSFTSGIDSTYDVYEWHFINMHPASDDVNFTFQFNASGGSGFNETITSTGFEAYLREDDGNSALTYRSTIDQAQGTSYQPATRTTSNDSDSSASGILTLYAPSSTTYVKHFVVTAHDMQHQAAYPAYARQTRVAGYINTTSAIDEIDFKFDSGNIDAGEIRMYGVATS